MLYFFVLIKVVEFFHETYRHLFMKKRGHIWHTLARASTE